MSEIVERVARAISDNIKAGLPNGVFLDYGYAARAAIEAMRQPTDEMMDAGKYVIWNSGSVENYLSSDGLTAGDVFSAMIDEMLK